MNAVVVGNNEKSVKITLVEPVALKESAGALTKGQIKVIYKSSQEAPWEL